MEIYKLVEKNIERRFLLKDRGLDALQELLLLPTQPHVMECFDISHISGTDLVGSMVQFREGKPDQSNYRRFKLKTVEGNDDFAAMREVVERRYTRLIQEKKELPDLILIDGGIGQLSSAQQILQMLELKIPLMGLAKKQEEIYLPASSQSLLLPKDHPALQLLIQMRNEAHRFAIKYHRHLRSKRMTAL